MEIIKQEGSLTYKIDEEFKSAGQENTFHCATCGGELRSGPYRILFCPNCKTSEMPAVAITWAMGCCHCKTMATIKLTSDGRRVCRCENPNCGDLWSMQDLQGITLEHPVGG